MKRYFRSIRTTTLAGFAVVLALAANASIQLPLTETFSGAPPATPMTPWVKADFAQDFGGTVLFTLAAPFLINPENVAVFYFNFDDSLNVEHLNFHLVSSGAFKLPSIDRSQNAFRADGDGKYDIRLSFATGGNLNHTFGHGDILTYQLSYPGGISPSDFVFPGDDAGGHGPFLAAAHVQNTPEGSAWIAAVAPVPEAPQIVTVALVALFCLFRAASKVHRLQTINVR